MARIHKWQAALDEVVRKHQFEPFAWGTSDCCMFAADCTFAITGVDPAAAVRGTYHDMAGAIAVLEANGGIEGLVRAHGGPEITVSEARVGDVGLTRFNGLDTLAVCMGQTFMAPSSKGLTVIPNRKIVRAWRCTKD